jgi:hypothetical protein
MVGAMSRRAALRALIRASPLIWPHLDRLTEQTVERVSTTIPFYRDTEVISRDELRTFARDNFEYIVGHDPDLGKPANSPPRAMGHAHARYGAPLADLLSAYKVGFALLWEVITEELVVKGSLGAAEATEMASILFWRAAEFGQEIVEGHREATTELVLRQEHERSAMVEALVTGTLVERAVLWETASRLDIPYSGNFLVIVAAAQALGGDPLPGVVTQLRKDNAASAWRLSPHRTVGVISMRDSDVGRAMRRLEACSTGHVGVSPLFRELDGAPRAFYLAGIALQSTPHPDIKVRRFDETPAAVLVAAAPDAASAIMRSVLGRLLDLPTRDQDTLLETFEMWLQSGGSAADAAIRLFCHPNTVRLRLHKLTELTGRPIDDPAKVVELAAALYAWRLIGARSDN